MKQSKRESLETFFEHDGEDYYKPVRVGKFQGNISIEYESNGHKN